MTRLENLFGAEIKKQFINTLPEKEHEQSIEHFVNLGFAEEMYGHLFDMDSDELISSVQMSVDAPSNISTARHIKTFLVKYYNWAKEVNLTSNSNPLNKIHPVKFCSDWAVAARYPKSIEALYELLMNEGDIDSERGRWSLLVVGALLIYEGIPDDEIGDLKMSDVDYDNKTVVAKSGVYELSDVTICAIQQLHSLNALMFVRSNVTYRVNASASEYVLPQAKTVFAPMVGKQLMKSMSEHKKKASRSLQDATWFTADSIAMAGKFDRIHSGKETNDLDVSTVGHIYEIWERVHHSEE